MNEKQNRFVREYLIDLNATQAAKRAGYSDRTAYAQGQRLLKHVEVEKAIRAEMDAHKSDRVASAEEVLEYLTAVVRGEEREELVAFVESGAERTDKQVTPRDRIRAAELLGKRYGLFADRVDMNVKASEKLAEIVDQIGGEGLEE